LSKELDKMRSDEELEDKASKRGKSPGHGTYYQ
jgi:hypothetical protein